MCCWSYSSVWWSVLGQPGLGVTHHTAGKPGLGPMTVVGFHERDGNCMALRLGCLGGTRHFCWVNQVMCYWPKSFTWQVRFKVSKERELATWREEL